MEINDYNFKPYKNLNPYLEDNTEQPIYDPVDGNDPALSGNKVDEIISDEMSLGNNNDVHMTNYAKQILVTGADFAKNLFDTFLFAIKSNGRSITQSDAFNDLAKQSKENELQLPNVWRTVGMYSFTTRTTKVEIPQPKAQTFDYTVGQYVIRKIKSEWEMPKKSSLTMRIDGLAYYIDAINLLSQNNDNAILNNKGIDHLSFMGFNKHLAENLKDGTRLDLVVRHVNPHDEVNHNSYLKNGERSFYRDTVTPDGMIGMINTRPDDARSMFWVFEDVKFLGWNDGLEFGHNSSGSQELTTEFIFKRLIRVDPMYLENYLGNTYKDAFDKVKINENINSEMKAKIF
ncbi:MAG: hypothetical protein IKK93_03265 [Campylobacter sp.]|nr:hypothetical protein [Campylobacter sp.]